MTRDTRSDRNRPRGCRCLQFLALGCLVWALPAAGQDPTRGRDGGDCWDQPFPCIGRPSFGLLAGTTVTPDHRTGFIGASDSYAIYEEGAVKETQVQLAARGPIRPLLGAFAEMNLGGNLALQATASFRRDGGAVQVAFLDGLTSEWSYAKYGHAVADAWEIPVALKYRLGRSDVRPFVAGGPAFRLWSRDNLFGASAAVGLDARWRQRWTATVQARYTRWGAARLSYMTRTSRNQVQVTIGLSR